jgi:hypothetical protein
MSRRIYTGVIMTVPRDRLEEVDLRLRALAYEVDPDAMVFGDQERAVEGRTRYVANMIEYWRPSIRGRMRMQKRRMINRVRQLRSHTVVRHPPR